MGKHETPEKHPWHRRMVVCAIRVMRAGRDVLIGGATIIMFEPVVSHSTNSHHIAAMVGMVTHVPF